MGKDRPPASGPSVSNTPDLTLNIGLVDPDIAGTTPTITLSKYKDAVSKFHAFFLQHRIHIKHYVDIDDMIMVYTNS